MPEGRFRQVAGAALRAEHGLYRTVIGRTPLNADGCSEATQMRSDVKGCRRIRTFEKEAAPGSFPAEGLGSGIHDQPIRDRSRDGRGIGTASCPHRS